MSTNKSARYNPRTSSSRPRSDYPRWRVSYCRRFPGAVCVDKNQSNERERNFPETHSTASRPLGHSLPDGIEDGTDDSNRVVLGKLAFCEEAVTEISSGGKIWIRSAKRRSISVQKKKAITVKLEIGQQSGLDRGPRPREVVRKDYRKSASCHGGCVMRTQSVIRKKWRLHWISKM